MMIAHLLLAAIAGCTAPGARMAPPAPPELPEDPFQRTAVRALGGEFGTLETWQANGYARGLKLGVTASQALVLTQYNYHEPDGKIDRRGRACSLRTCAVSRARWRTMENDWIWTPKGIRQVRDSGANSNERHENFRAAVRKHGLASPIWCDYWYKSGSHARRAGVDGWVGTIGAVIPGN